MKYIIKRFLFNDDGTIGQFMQDGQQICVTGELPWLDNHPKTSCIPTGTYQVIKHDSPAHPDTWEITGVPDRSAILLHNGNAPEVDSEGCLLVGSSYGKLEGKTAVFNSVATLDKLRDILPDTFTLTIE